MSERSLLAALIAGLILPPTAAAQATWDCRPDPHGGWQCHAAAGDAETGAAVAAPAPAAPASPATAPAAPPVTPVSPPPAPREAAVPVTSEAAPTATGIVADTRNAAEPYGPWALCAPRPVAALPPATLADTILTADRAEIEQNRFYTLTGDAVVEQPGQRIRADRIRYDETRDEVQADGDVRLDQSTLQVTGDSATLQLGSDTGEIHAVRYFVPAQHARGRAEIARQESATIRSFEHATYSTCDEDRERWRLHARSV
ncbi:MAG: LptA/OstA family protein, partial [Thiohalobacteraceae bacterium]